MIRGGKWRGPVKEEGPKRGLNSRTFGTLRMCASPIGMLCRGNDINRDMCISLAICTWPNGMRQNRWAGKSYSARYDSFSMQRTLGLNSGLECRKVFPSTRSSTDQEGSIWCSLTSLGRVAKF